MTSRAGGWALVAPALLWTLCFFVLPFAVMAAMSLARLEGRELVWGFDLGNYARLGDPAIARAVLVSLEITLTVTVVSVLLAYPLAAILAFRVPERWRRLALMLAILPFWTSYVVRSYSWLLVLSREGIVNRVLMGIGLTDAPLTLANTRFATVTGFVHFFTMLLTLTIYANLVQLPRNYARAAQDLGASRWQTFRHVILPLTLPGIVTGAFLTFVLCIGDYVTPQILGGNRELALPQVIMLQLGRRADFPLASALSVALMGMVTLAYLLSARWLRLDRL
ncbi:ABC-type spermidine/putrescine transport system, permease component I [Rubellimicrobium thermophilum DSM 16684]|uniref:ABC-type spermidine/putrescine transport system, permease component I n=1 Tax=Rubellimicrobium thermophilum DSM 16684 TaxID=1123069 RepID=S9S2U6_9RHOB|nr:ABC transporter permease [Rubellimicrobium thermophilum]EPX84510.1 ABC-type spermidine/putrescine transport system, permease component I [Rubellimicrobium thermophilum DSM 16684]